jgi:hypothetical protein
MICDYLKFLKERIIVEKMENKDKIDVCVNKILSFLSEIGVSDWNDFMKMKPVDRDIVSVLIDKDVDNMNEIGEVRFKIRFKLSDKNQLIEYKKELEVLEEYEKCAMISKKLNKWI